MSLTIGSEAPDFTAQTTHGELKLHEWIGDGWAVLFSHPRLASEIPSARNLLAAWGGEGLMQEAVVAWLTGSSHALPSAGGGLDR